MKPLFLIFSFIIGLSSFAVNEVSSKQMKLKLVHENEGEVIWGLTFIDKDHAIYTTRSGNLFRLNLKTGKGVKLNPPSNIYSYGQGGLLDAKVFKIKEKDFLYVTFSTSNKGTKTTALARTALDGKDNKKLSWEILFKAKVISDTTRHFGSRLAYDGRYLYMTIGDRGKRHYAQDLKTHNGKILRLLPSGLAAPGNPFAKQGLAEIWSYGHRNPQGISWDGSKLYSCEFGPRGGDELNLIERGKNYGWPVITYGREYYGPKIGVTSKEGMEQPLTYWVPSISPSGLKIYRGERYKNWKGSLFLANLSSRHLRRVVLKEKKVVKEEKLFADLEERVRHVESSPEDYLFFTTDSGKIYQIL